MNEEGNVCESYEVENTESAFNAFKSRYLDLKPEIALEVSTSGKYIARKLRDMGFSVHLADPSKLSLIFMTAKKNDKEDSYPSESNFPHLIVSYELRRCLLFLIQVSIKI